MQTASAPLAILPLRAAPDPFMQHKQQRYSRSNSLSSASVVTIKHPGSVGSGSAGSRMSGYAMRAQTPGDDLALPPLRAAYDPMPQDHKRRRSMALDASESVANDSFDSQHRWSRSTHSNNSSVSSVTNPRRHRSSSGVLYSSAIAHQFSPGKTGRTPHDQATRDSPQRKHLEQRPRSRQRSSSPPQISPRRNINESLTALPPLHTLPALTDPNDTESPSTSQTVATPATQSSLPRHDYFGGKDVSPRQKAMTRQVLVEQNPIMPSSTMQHSRKAGSDGYDSANVVRHTPPSAQEQRPRTSHGSEQRKPAPEQKQHRGKERPDKDKKAMLARALQQANNAVLLDNAQNYEGALESYSDACDLLQMVMSRTSGEDDRRKLDAIKLTYSNRIDELEVLVQARPSTAEEKELPRRPSTHESILPSPVTITPGPHDAAVEDPSQAETSTSSNSNLSLRLPSYLARDRDSFFSGTMAAVGNFSTRNVNSGHFSAQPLGAVEASAEEAEPASEDQTIRQQTLHLPLPEQDRFMPMPLSPRKPSPVSPPQEEQMAATWQGPVSDHRQPPRDDASRSRADSNESSSWLDPIDESTSDTSSMHSMSFEGGVRRKHIRGTSDPDFDAAFDAAVEAAYDEGFEPDLEARRKRLTALLEQQASSSSTVKQPLGPSPADSVQEIDELDDEEEEAILDALTNDYAPGFNFDLQSKPPLPRQSDSSGYSRSTWQSSQMSDRATAATSLSTVTEDDFSNRLLTKSNVAAPSSHAMRPDGNMPPPPGAPPRMSLPRTPALPNNRASSVRNRRLSGQNHKQLKIETTTSKPESRKRASTFHHAGSPFLEDEEKRAAMPEQPGRNIEALQPMVPDAQHDDMLASPPSTELRPFADDHSKGLLTPTIEYRPSYEGSPGDPTAGRPHLYRKNKSSASLKEHQGHTLLLASPDVDSHPSITPISSTFMTFAAAKRNQNPMTSQRAALPSFGPAEGQQSDGIYLFDTTLSATRAPLSPRSPNMSTQPTALEPCPESFLLRPFWLMRNLGATITHPRGGFVTTKMFVARQVWETRGVKLKLVEDKIANCDLLTAALGRLAGVDTYDADAVMEELQNFEEVLDRVQANLAKKLGNDVGVNGAAATFKDAPVMPKSGSGATGSGDAGFHGSTDAPVDKASKSNSGKSYLSSWRKLRSKSSGAPLTTGSHKIKAAHVGQEQHLIPSVPMTSFVPVERRGYKRDARNLMYEGPNREYMGSLARLFDGVQVLDQIARQVEDPGLKHSSPTHVGLELSIRHAAEFFGFYVCRFVLADLGMLLDKFVKRGSEWVLA